MNRNGFAPIILILLITIISVFILTFNLPQLNDVLDNLVGNLTPTPTVVSSGPSPTQIINTNLTFEFTLNGDQEVPPTTPQGVAASGTGLVTVDINTNVLTYEINFSGLSSIETDAHIHGPANVGQNASVLHALPTGQSKSGIWEYPESLEADIINGQTYVNIHSEDFPSGEIRGQIAHTAPSPTPTNQPTQPTPTSTSTSGSGSLTTQGINYNNDSSATISRNQSSKVQLPETLINPSQGWVAVRLKVGFSSTDSLSPDPIIWDMTESDPNGSMFTYYDLESDSFRMARDGVAQAQRSLNSGDTITIISAWTTSSVMISIDGGNFVTGSSSSVPGQAPFFIGSSERQTPNPDSRQPNSDYYWVAAGTGTLTNAQAAQIHAFGNTDPGLSAFPGNPTFFWPAENDQYQK